MKHNPYCVMLAFLASGLVQWSAAQTLQEAVTELRSLREGPATRFDQVDATLDRLLKDYTQPADVATLYYHAAQVYSDSGLLQPQKTIVYAKRALEYADLDPKMRQRTFTCLGDAMQVSHRGVTGEALIQARREAVVPYLQGLKELLQYKLPAAPPALPTVQGFDYTGPTNTALYQSLKRQNEEQAKARDAAVFLKEMLLCRDTQTKQICYIYSRFPFDSENLRSLAMEVLQDEIEVDRLMAAVDAAVAKRAKEMGLGPDTDMAIERMLVE